MIYKRRLLQKCNERGIETLVHFTNVINLPSIINNGLLSRNVLDTCFIDYCFNDSIRWDLANDSVSLSVTSPNYRMFYKVRCNNQNSKWAVILLDAFEVLKLDCAFCYTNAANASIASIPINDRKSITSFDLMFSEELFGNNREELCLESYETTDPQAEILVFEPIQISAIKFIIFERYETMNEYKPLLDAHGIQSAVDLGYFRPRRDYEYWR